MATRQIAQGLAGLGRNGDSMLMHVQPSEVAGLQALAKSQGTSLTINPDTGLPEAFSLGGFFNSLAPTIVGGLVSMIPGMQPFGLSAMQSGILAGAATGALTNRKNPLMGAAMGGLGGWGGANLAQSAMGAAGTAGDAATKAGIDKTIAQVNTPGAVVSNTADTMHALPGQGWYGQGAGTLQQGPIAESMSGVKIGGYGTVEPTFESNLAKAYENVAADPMKFVGQNKMAIGMPLATATLSGLEPSDLGYNTDLTQSSAGKYDPYSRLNLAGDTGLRLYASGGPVSFADGGDALKGGGAEAMQGSGLLPLDVSDINAKYGYSGSQPMASSGFGRGISANPADYLANSTQPAQVGMAFGGRGGLGTFGMRGPAINIEPPKLGLFASNEAIEEARTAYEQQLAAAMAGRGGMGSTANAPQMARSMGTLSGGPATTTTTGIAGLTGMGSTAATAPTASTAETALSRLNLNKNYATGGSIATGGIRDLYSTPDDQTNGAVLSRDGYGLGRLQSMADGGIASYAKGGYLDGPGDGMSDDIPATIEGKQPARLADGEFVIPADVVSHLGNGSTKAGSQRLYGMLDRVRKARTGSTKQGRKINAAKLMPA